MANVRFTVTRDLPLPATIVFDELVDWKGHANWVPLTRVEILSGDGGPGTEFVATSGLGPLALPDRMRVDELDPVARTVRITKIGPVLTGTVRLSVTSTGDSSSRLEWFEDIRVPVLPQFLAKPVARGRPSGLQHVDHQDGEAAPGRLNRQADTSSIMPSRAMVTGMEVSASSMMRSRASSFRNGPWWNSTRWRAWTSSAKATASATVA